MQKTNLGTATAKLPNAGEQLFLRVGNSRREEGDEDLQNIFGCNLLEDLYWLERKKGDEEGH